MQKTPLCRQKTCTKCFLLLPLDMFYWEAGRGRHRASCKKCVRATSNSWRGRNLERARESTRNYRKNNKSTVRDTKRKWEAEQRKNNSLYRKEKNTRRGLHRLLKGEAENSKYSYLLGCSPQEWRDHLEARFQEGMSWDNYGEWVVDHIIPVSAYDLSTKAGDACWHYTNTQPLWAKDNVEKGDSLPKTWNTEPRDAV